jgi:hypothetical protein
LREQRDVGGELEEIARRLDDATIAIDNVSDRMERVEGDADRQNDIEPMIEEAPAEGVRQRGERPVRRRGGPLTTCAEKLA